MLRASSSTTSTLRPRSTSLRAVQPLEHRLLLRRQVGDDAVQEQRGLVEQPLGRLHVLQHDALGHRLEPRPARRAVRSLPVKTTTGTSASAGSACSCSSSSKPVMSGRRRSSTTQSNGCVEHAPPAPRRRVPTAAISMSSWPSSSTIDVALDVVVLDHQQPLGARRGEVLDAVERRLQAGGGRRLDEVGERAVRQAVLALLLERDDLHRDVARAPGRA